MPQSRRLTAAEIASLSNTDLRDRVQLGGLLYLRAQAKQGTPERTLLDRLYTLARSVEPHPAASALRDPLRHPELVGDRKRGLAASDLEWIRRLPEDPAEISDGDLSTLAGMRNACPDNAISDRRLLGSIIEPAHAAWRERAAVTEAESAAERNPPLRPGRDQAWRQEIREAVAERIREDMPDLTLGAAREQAVPLIDQALGAPAETGTGSAA